MLQSSFIINSDPLQLENAEAILLQLHDLLKKPNYSKESMEKLSAKFYQVFKEKEQRTINFLSIMEKVELVQLVKDMITVAFSNLMIISSNVCC